MLQKYGTIGYLNDLMLVSFKSIYIYIFWIIIPLISQSQEINHIRFEQKNNKIYIYYYLSSNNNIESFNINLYYSDDNGKTWHGPLKSVSGNIGKNVRTRGNNVITWDVLNDYDKLIGNIVFKIVAKPQYKTKKVKKKYYVSKGWFGFKFGGILTRTVYNNINTNFLDNPYGYNLGVIIKANSKKAFSFQFEFLYENIPVRLDNNSTKVLHYNSLPLLAQFNFGKLKTKYFFEFGIPLNFPYVEGISFDLGLIVGGGLNLYTSDKRAFNFDIRYYHGLNDIIGYDYSGGSSNTLKKSTLSLSIAYLFGW